MTLTEFLLARIAEDERNASDIELDLDRHGVPHGAWGERRILAECEAKRRIVELHPVDLWWNARGKPRCATCAVWDEADFDGPPMVEWPCPTLLAVALPYGDHPDYDQAWRP